MINIHTAATNTNGANGLLIVQINNHVAQQKIIDDAYVIRGNNRTNGTNCEQNL
jgi:hypothetical protein